jgi:hypothetical protein
VGIRVRIFIILAIVVLVLPTAAPAQTDPEKDQENQIKAAFLYNFIKFVDWPQEKMPNNDEPIIIGIVNADGFTKAFDPIKGKKIKDKDVIIKEFKSLEKLKEGTDEWNQQIDEFKKCHILLFHNCSDKKVLGQALAVMAGLPVLTVGHAEEFLESGGNINFLLEDKKVRFEVNLPQVKRNDLKISSKLLKLAKRVVE